MGVVAGRRLRPAPPLLPKTVGALDGAGGDGPFLKSRQRRLETGDDPMHERPAGGVGVFADKAELGRARRDARPLERGRHVLAVVGVAGRDRGVVVERRAAQLDGFQNPTFPQCQVSQMGI